jgi:hypothetical protein
MLMHMTKYLALSVLLVGGVARAQQYPDVDYETPAGTYQPPPPGTQPQAQPQAQYYGYVGTHPFPHEVGSGWCQQTDAHFHEYAPFDEHLFRQNNGYFYFVGDAGDFSYAATTWAYQGNHPIPATQGGGYCYIDWQHRHHFAPPTYGFNYNGAAYVYSGAWDPLYYTHLNRYRSYYGGYYRNNYYGNRYYTTRPVHTYRPTYGWGSPGVYRPGVTVTSPSGLSVTVGGGYRPGYRPGGVYVAPPRPSYVAPAPVYRPGVYVAPPRPAPVYVAPPRPYVRPSYSPAPGVRISPPGIRRY